jgi:hypothetical protein
MEVTSMKMSRFTMVVVAIGIVLAFSGMAFATFATQTANPMANPIAGGMSAQQVVPFAPNSGYVSATGNGTAIRLVTPGNVHECSAWNNSPSPAVGDNATVVVKGYQGTDANAAFTIGTLSVVNSTPATLVNSGLPDVDYLIIDPTAITNTTAGIGWHCKTYQRQAR